MLLAASAEEEKNTRESEWKSKTAMAMAGTTRGIARADRTRMTGSRTETRSSLLVSESEAGPGSLIWQPRGLGCLADEAAVAAASAKRERKRLRFGVVEAAAMKVERRASSASCPPPLSPAGRLHSAHKTLYKHTAADCSADSVTKLLDPKIREIEFKKRKMRDKTFRQKSLLFIAFSCVSELV